MLLARKCYELVIRQRRVIFFVDNEAARYAMIHGSSPSISLLKVVQAFHSCSVADSSIVWRADLPSRGHLQEAAHLVRGKIVNLDREAQDLANQVSNFDDTSFRFLLSCSDSAADVSNIFL